MTTSGKDCRAWRAESVPFEAQSSRTAPGRCGAAALVMVLRSLGLEVSQRDIRQALEAERTAGAHTHRLAQVAHKHGCAALIVQARCPWQLLERCQLPSLRVILNHRLTFFASTGHFSVLVGMDCDTVMVHDPGQGPWRRIGRDELELLWRPEAGAGPIAGQVLLALGQPTAASVSCEECGVAIPASLVCPACGQRVDLQPAAILGCMKRDCPERAWVRIYCPGCDTVCAEY
ncbi:MAG: cysteine peptidase family C39 domain-containing protein [Gemmataceae bacterium]